MKRITQGASTGGDFNAGQRTYGMLRQAGLEEVHIRAAVVALQNGHSSMRLPLQFATSLRQRILDAELLTEVELDEALSECEEIARNPETFVMSFLVTQVWGRKRVDSCVYCAREKSMGLEQAVAAKGHKGALLFAEASLDEWLDGAGEIVGSDGLVFPIESQIIMARKEILRASRCLRCAEACRQNTRLRKRTARSVHDGQEWSWGRASEERTWI